VRIGPPHGAGVHYPGPWVDDGVVHLEPAIYRCGDFHIDATNRSFRFRGDDVALEPKIFAVIVQLVSRPGVLVTRNELLDSIWGHRYVTPSTLSRLITLARRAFRDDSEEPRYIQTVHGAGYRYVGPVDREEPAVSERAWRFGPPPTARLPARIEDLIGRERELTTLTALFRDHRTVTVLGTGGMGKTQCALECARRLGPEFPDGVWFFDLAPAKQGADWLRSLAAALAVPPAAPTELLQKVLPLLQGRRALLVIDNCDRVATEVGALVFEVLRRTDQSKVLATSQAPLNFVGEQLMRMPPLALPAEPSGGVPTLAEIRDAPAVRMLLARISAVQPGFLITDGNAATLAEICRRLDGMPLALELAAARFALLTPGQVLERLQHRFRFLSSDMSGRDPRHRNLLLLLDWSFGLLSADEQRLLAWFSVFVQGWSMEAAMGLAASFGRDPDMVVELLTGLVNKSLVSVSRDINPPRYFLLESVREYALAHLRAAQQETRARDAHLAFVVSMSRTARTDMLGGRMRERVAQLTHEHGNIGSAVEHALNSDGNHNAALSILGSLTLYAKARGIHDQAVHWFTRALETTQSIDTVERAGALLCRGVTAVHLGSNDDAPDRYLIEAIRLAHLHGDRWTEACAAGYLALWLTNGGEAGKAAEVLQTTQRISEQLDDPFLRGLAGLARGWICMAQDRCAAAIEVLRAVRGLGQDLHQRHFIDMYIGLALFGLGHYAEAAHQWVEAMLAAAEVANIRGVAGSIEGCAYIEQKLGDPRMAATLMRAAGLIRERTEVPLFNFWVPYHTAALEAVRRALSANEYEQAMHAGELMRDEDAANEARMRLRGFATRQ